VNALNRGLYVLLGNSQISAFHRQLLQADIDLYANRSVQPLSSVWQEHGLFKREKAFLEKQIAGTVAMDERLFNYAGNRDLLYSSEPRAPALDQAVREAEERAAITRKEALENEVEEGNMVNAKDMSDEKYEQYITMDHLEQLPFQHRVTRAKVGDYVILSGDPIYVAQIVELNIFDKELDEEGCESTTHLMEIVWFTRDNGDGCPWSSKYRMEPNEECIEEFKKKNKKKSASQQTAKPPAFLPSHHQYAQRLPLYDAYCIFELDKQTRTIPIEVIEWMKTHTKIEDEYRGRQEEERAAQQKSKKPNKHYRRQGEEEDS